MLTAILNRTRNQMASRMVRQSAFANPMLTPLTYSQSRSFSYGKQSYFTEVDEDPMEKLSGLQ